MPLQPSLQSLRFEGPEPVPQQAVSSVILSDTTFRLLREFIYEKSGIFFPDNKKYLVESRLSKRIESHQLKDYEEYLYLLRYGTQRDAELQALFNAITINETFFFRNEPQLTALETHLLPEILLVKKTNGRCKLRIWSAGASTGEEAYTTAMILLEKFIPKFPYIEVEIIGTDINSWALETARKGVYREYAVRNMPQYYLDKYFLKDNGNYFLREEVKRLVKFSFLNLYDEKRMRLMNDFDIIFCCNVLIYFDQKSKTQVVANLYDSLNRGGYLFIGYSESLHGISKAFKLVHLPKTIAYKKE